MTTYSSRLSSKSRATTAMLAFFLGWLGAHRFYIGKRRSAILMLALGVIGIAITLYISLLGTKTLLPLTVIWVWVVVDFIIVVLGRLKDGEGKYIKKW